MRKRRLLLTPPDVPPPCAGVLLLVSVLVGVALVGACPAVCSCSPSSRQVDCSSRGLRVLPPGLQHNLHSLNLSHNHLGSLDHQLSPFTHLRFLDLSNNSLARLPSALPRGLWELRAAHNAIRLLHKNDTAYQWNLRLLDLSGNHLERAVFINNTLTSLRSLNLSHNRFWTLPTNLPSGLVTVDLSHNSLVQVLPGSLDRLPGLVHLDLHANRFSRLGGGVFSLLTGLKLLSLGGNPWSCEDPSSMAPLLAWLQQTPARVLGCPCSPRSVCGQARTPRTGGWHYASYTLPPLAASEPSRGDSWPPSHARPTGWWYLSEPIHHTLRAPSSFTLHPQHLSSPPPSSSSPPSLLPHTRHADGLQSSTTPLHTHLLFLTHTPPTPNPSTPPDLPPPSLTPDPYTPPDLPHPP